MRTAPHLRTAQTKIIVSKLASATPVNVWEGGAGAGTGEPQAPAGGHFPCSRRGKYPQSAWRWGSETDEGASGSTTERYGGAGGVRLVSRVPISPSTSERVEPNVWHAGLGEVAPPAAHVLLPANARTSHPKQRRTGRETRQPHQGPKNLWWASWWCRLLPAVEPQMQREPGVTSAARGRTAEVGSRTGEHAHKIARRSRSAVRVR